MTPEDTCRSRRSSGSQRRRPDAGRRPWTDGCGGLLQGAAELCGAEERSQPGIRPRARCEESAQEPPRCLELASSEETDGRAPPPHRRDYTYRRDEPIAGPALHQVSNVDQDGAGDDRDVNVVT